MPSLEKHFLYQPSQTVEDLAGSKLLHSNKSTIQIFLHLDGRLGFYDSCDLLLHFWCPVEQQRAVQLYAYHS